MLNQVEVSQVIRLGRGDTVATPFQRTHDAFSYQVKEHPSNTAVRHNGEIVTYEELDRASTQLSRTLIKLGLRPRNRVVILVQRSIPMVIAILAVLRSGCQYVPLDGGVVSDAALDHVLSETEPSFILCLDRFAEKAHRFAGGESKVLVLDDASTAGPDVDLELGETAQVGPDDGAYIIYTSGSTGTPKGVDVSHRNVTNLLTTGFGDLGIHPGSKVAQILSIAFDMAAWEILGTLMNGGTLCLRNSD